MDNSNPDGARLLQIPAYRSLAQRLDDSALKVEALRIKKEDRDRKVKSEGGQCCQDHDHELMQAEILYREQILQMELLLRRTRQELNRTRLPIVRTMPERVGHPVPVGETDPAEIAALRLGYAPDEDPTPSRFQQMADEYNRPMTFMTGGQAHTVHPKPRDAQ